MSTVQIVFASLLVLALSVAGQYHPYSLQSAVDALHRREAQLAFENKYGPSSYDELWIDELPPVPSSHDQERLANLFERYMAHADENERNPTVHGYNTGNFYGDDYGPEEVKKRSVFRERAGSGIPHSVFREREQDNKIGVDLVEEFLDEIEREKEYEREKDYKKNLKALWDKYLMDELEIEHQLFDEPNEENVGKLTHPHSSFNKKMSLPANWYPAKKKRFIVYKRSTGDNKQGIEKKTNENVVKELAPLFNTFEKKSDKKKRSSGDESIPPTDSTTPQITMSTSDIATTQEVLKREDHHNDDGHHHTDEHHGHHHDHNGDHHHEHHHSHGRDRHQDPDHEHDQEDYSDENEGDEPEGDDTEGDDEDDEFDEEDDMKKRKRDIIQVKKRSTMGMLNEGQSTYDFADNKKKRVVDWDNYFGYDRKKKSINMHDDRKRVLKKAIDWDNYFGYNKKKRSQENWFMDRARSEFEKRRSNEYESNRPESNNDDEINIHTLAAMGNELREMESYIINDTIALHDRANGYLTTLEEKLLKDEIYGRMETIYNIENLRQAIDAIKGELEIEQHSMSAQTSGKLNQDKAKRVAVKKEKVEFANSDHSIDEPHDKISEKEPNNDLPAADDEQLEKKKKRDNENVHESEHKKSMYHLGEVEPDMDDEDNPLECPILHNINNVCQSMMVKNSVNFYHNIDFYNLCVEHLLCYQCGSTKDNCDGLFRFKSNRECKPKDIRCRMTAHKFFMVLEDFPKPLIGVRECSKVPCLAVLNLEGFER